MGKQEHHVVCTRRIELERLCKNLTDENEALKRTHGEVAGQDEEKEEDIAVVEQDVKVDEEDASVVVIEEQCDVEEVSETFADNDDIALVESDDDSIGDGGAQLEYEYENIGLQAAVRGHDTEYLKLLGDCEKLRFDNDELLEENESLKRDLETVTTENKTEKHENILALTEEVASWKQEYDEVHIKNLELE